MRRLHHGWRRAFDALGSVGLIALASSVLAGALAALSLGPLRAEHDELLQRKFEAQQRLRAARPGASARSAGPAEQITAFYASFPAMNSTPQWLARIEHAATANGLALPSGEYRVDRHAEQRLARYQITLPVNGSYAQMRGFIGEVLRDVPAASLDDVQFKRDSGGSRLEARIRLSLYLNGQ
jgi:Tfp pilus assembly protein PilO